MVRILWQWGALLAGIGFFVLCLFTCFILLNLTRSLRILEAILSLTLDETRLALPELRHSLEQIDEMVSGVNDKFTAADRALTTTADALASWRTRLRRQALRLTRWGGRRGTTG